MKAKGILLISAGAAIILGGLLTASSYFMGAFNRPAPTIKTDEISSSGITAISIDSQHGNDIQILPHNNDTIKIVYYTGNYSISSIDGVANIHCTDTRKQMRWYDFINLTWFYGEDHDMYVYIPSSLYSDISVYSEYGDIGISGINAISLDITSKSGDIDIEDGKFAALNIEAKYGDINLDKISADMYISSNSGDIEIEEISGNNLKFKCKYGDIKGTIKGNKNDYMINAYTNFGDCNLSPKLDGIYKLEAQNDSGDISIKFDENNF